MKAAFLSTILTLGSNPNADTHDVLAVYTAAPEGGPVQRQLYTAEQFRDVFEPRLVRAGSEN